MKIDIYFTAVGMIDLPGEKEALSVMEQIRNGEEVKPLERI